MLKRENLIIGKIAGGKYQWLLVSDNFTMATDGSVIAFTKRPEIKNAPTWVGPDIQADQKQGRFLIPIDKVMKLLKSFPKRKTNTYAESIFLLKSENGHRRLLVNSEEEILEEYNSHIPNFKHIWPKRESKVSISFSVEKLLNVLKMLKEADGGESAVVNFEFYNSKDPAKFTCRLAKENQEIVGLIMPTCED